MSIDCGKMHLKIWGLLNMKLKRIERKNEMLFDVSHTCI